MIPLNWIDWITILGYFLFALGVGFLLKKRSGKSTEEFFLSGRSLPWWIAGTSMVATTFAVDTPLVISSYVWKGGIWKNVPEALL
jgi:Na+/proline symporter